MNVSREGLQFIADHEGLALLAYFDGGGVLTLGYGHTRNVKLGQTCTADEALSWLRSDAQDAVDAVNACTHVPLSQNQFDALVSLTFNIGAHAFKNSTCSRYVNAGDFMNAANEFRRWRFDNGIEVKGLLNRRIDERKLFEAPT